MQPRSTPFSLHFLGRRLKSAMTLILADNPRWTMAVDRAIFRRFDPRRGTGLIFVLLAQASRGRRELGAAEYAAAARYAVYILGPYAGVAAVTKSVRVPHALITQMSTVYPEHDHKEEARSVVASLDLPPALDAAAARAVRTVQTAYRFFADFSIDTGGKNKMWLQWLASFAAFLSLSWAPDSDDAGVNAARLEAMRDLHSRMFADLRVMLPTSFNYVATAVNLMARPYEPKDRPKKQTPALKVR